MEQKGSKPKFYVSTSSHFLKFLDEELRPEAYEMLNRKRAIAISRT